jgi:prepilin-type N-terminal cleavage/methylation domain-containing protein
MTARRAARGRRRRGRTGFSLVEVLVSVTMFLVATAAVPIGARIAARAAATARDGTAAVGLAQGKLEELLHDRSGPGTDHDVVQLAGTTFTRAWRIDPDATGRATAAIAVTVIWNHGRHAVTMESATWGS